MIRSNTDAFQEIDAKAVYEHRVSCQKMFRRQIRAGIAATFLMGLLLSGCASGKHRYSHKTLPTQMLAAKRDNVQTLDLTKVARPGSNSEAIDRGDVIDVTIAVGLDDKSSIKLPVRVNDQGIASLPEIGDVKVAGLEMEAAEAAIVAACIERQVYLRPTVTVEMKRQRTNLVTVTGAVKKPDVYELPRGRSDMVAAIVAAGGLDKDAGTKVEIRNPRRGRSIRSSPVASGTRSDVDTVGHSSPLNPDAVTASSGTQPDLIEAAYGSLDTLEVDLVSATKTGNSGYIVEDGGIVRVEKRDPEPLHVIGHVKKPDRYDFPIAEDLRVTDAIAMAGGTDMSVADKVFVIRRVPNSSDTAVIAVSLREAKRNSQANIRLEPGDVVSIENSVATAMWELVNTFRFSTGLSVPAAGIF